MANVYSDPLVEPQTQTESLIMSKRGGKKTFAALCIKVCLADLVSISCAGTNAHT